MLAARPPRLLTFCRASPAYFTERHSRNLPNSTHVFCRMRFTYSAERRFGHWECSEKSAEVARQDVREPVGTERAAGIPCGRGGARKPRLYTRRWRARDSGGTAGGIAPAISCSQADSRKSILARGCPYRLPRRGIMARSCGYFACPTLSPNRLMSSCLLVTPALR